MYSPFQAIGFKNLKFVISFLWKSSPGWHIINISILVSQSILPLIIIYQIKLIVDTVSQSKNYTYPAIFSIISWLILSIIIISILSNFVEGAKTLLKAKHNQIISEAVLDVLHNQSILVDLQYYDSPKYHDTFYRVQTDTVGRIFGTFNQLQAILQSLVSIAAMVSVLVFFHWIIVLVLFISVFPDILISFKLSKKQYQWQQEKTSTNREGAYYNWLITSNYAAKEIRLLDVGELLKKRAKTIRSTLFNEGLKFTKKSTLWKIGTKTIELVAVYGLFLFLIVRALKGMLSIGDLVMYYQIFTKAQASINALLSGISGLFIDNLFFKNLIEFLSYESVVKDALTPVVFPTTVQKVEFRNVCFKYPNHDKMILKNINLTASEGDRIAIVGKNGSGKSSLIKLLCRLYNTTSGGIYINGTECSHFRIKQLRENISVLFQDYNNYQIKAGENIWIGDVKLATDDRKIESSAVRTGADEFIQCLPLQYESILGKMFENGEELSSGQWQKVALARTLVRDAQIVILDEPSSALDAKAERSLFEKICEYTQDKILILISHRLSSIMSATFIYFIENGEIIESGTHENLMKLNGKYAEMFNLTSTEYDFGD